MEKSNTFHPYNGHFHFYLPPFLIGLKDSKKCLIKSQIAMKNSRGRETFSSHILWYLCFGTRYYFPYPNCLGRAPIRTNQPNNERIRYDLRNSCNLTHRYLFKFLSLACLRSSAAAALLSKARYRLTRALSTPCRNFQSAGKLSIFFRANSTLIKFCEF